MESPQIPPSNLEPILTETSPNPPYGDNDAAIQPQQHLTPQSDGYDDAAIQPQQDPSLLAQPPPDPAAFNEVAQPFTPQPQVVRQPGLYDNNRLAFMSIPPNQSNMSSNGQLFSSVSTEFLDYCHRYHDFPPYEEIVHGKLHEEGFHEFNTKLTSAGAIDHFENCLLAQKLILKHSLIAHYLSFVFRSYKSHYDDTWTRFGHLPEVSQLISKLHGNISRALPGGCPNYQYPQPQFVKEPTPSLFTKEQPVAPTQAVTPTPFPLINVRGFDIARIEPIFHLWCKYNRTLSIDIVAAEKIDYWADFALTIDFLNALYIAVYTLRDAIIMVQTCEVLSRRKYNKAPPAQILTLQLSSDAYPLIWQQYHEEQLKQTTAQKQREFDAEHPNAPMVVLPRTVNGPTFDFIREKIIAPKTGITIRSHSANFDDYLVPGGPLSIPLRYHSYDEATLQDELRINVTQTPVHWLANDCDKYFVATPRPLPPVRCTAADLAFIGETTSEKTLKAINQTILIRSMNPLTMQKTGHFFAKYLMFNKSKVEFYKPIPQLDQYHVMNVRVNKTKYLLTSVIQKQDVKELRPLIMHHFQMTEVLFGTYTKMFDHHLEIFRECAEKFPKVTAETRLSPETAFGLYVLKSSELHRAFIPEDQFFNSSDMGSLIEQVKDVFNIFHRFTVPKDLTTFHHNMLKQYLPVMYRAIWILEREISRLSEEIILFNTFLNRVECEKLLLTGIPCELIPTINAIHAATLDSSRYIPYSNDLDAPISLYPNDLEDPNYLPRLWSQKQGHRFIIQSLQLNLAKFQIPTRQTTLDANAFLQTSRFVPGSATPQWLQSSVLKAYLYCARPQLPCLGAAYAASPYGAQMQVPQFQTGPAGASAAYQHYAQQQQQPVYQQAPPSQHQYQQAPPPQHQYQQAPPPQHQYQQAPPPQQPIASQPQTVQPIANSPYQVGAPPTDDSAVNPYG